MDLFAVTPSSDNLGARPRAATDREMRAYLDWIAARRGIAVPDGATYGAAGIYDPRGKVQVLDMPGYGQSTTVTCEILDDAGEVARRMMLPVDNRGKLPMTSAQAKDWTGLAAVRKPRAKPAAVTPPTIPAHAPTEPAPMIDTPAPVIAAVAAPLPVPAPIDAAAVLDAMAAEVPQPAADLAMRMDAAAAVAIAERNAAPVNAATVQGANAIWMRFVANAADCPVDGWQIAAGPQRDRKARNRGKVVISGPAIEAMRARFEDIMGGHYEAVGLPAPAAAPVEACAAPAPAADLATTVAALAARVVTLERRVASGVRPIRTAGHAATIRRAWAMRREMRQRADLDRRALLAANAAAAQAATNEAAARADLRKACDRAIEAAANADYLRDEVTAAETALARLRTDAAADRARLDQLAPLLAAIGSIAPPPAAAAPARDTVTA